MKPLQNTNPDTWRDPKFRPLGESVFALCSKTDPMESRFWKKDAALRFEADALGSWPRDATDAIKEFLSTKTPLGCLVPMDDPPGTTYEFIFRFTGRDFYGKILLVEDLSSVIVFSAHRPLKPKLRCD